MDGVDDCDLVLGLHHLAALDRGRSGLEARGDLDCLVLVGRVLVRADKGSVNEQLLENHGLRAAELARIEGKGHVLGPVLGLRRELGRGGYLLAVRGLQRPAGLRVHEGALEFVFGARDEACVLDGVHDCGLAVGCDFLISVGAIGCRRLDLGRDDLDGLPLVGQVLVACDHVAVGLEPLEYHELLVREGRGVDRERHLHLALGVLGLEGRGRRDGVSICVLQGLAGSRIHQRAGHGVLAARGEVLIGDLVLDGHGLADADCLVAVGRIGSGRADLDGQELDRLVLVLRVLMRCLDLAVKVETLEHDGPMAPEKRGVELELNLLLAA